MSLQFSLGVFFRVWTVINVKRTRGSHSVLTNSIFCYAAWVLMNEYGQAITSFPNRASMIRYEMIIYWSDKDQAFDLD